MGRCTDENGVVHRVERIVEPVRLAAISDAVGANSVLIADGHHRYAISRTYRDEVRASTGRTDTDAELTMTYVAELVDEQLSIDPIHRVYRGITRRRVGDATRPVSSTSPKPDRSRRGSPARPSLADRCAWCARTAPACG